MSTRKCYWVSAHFLILFFLPLGAQGQVREVVVGITPTCPYGLTGCWGGAAEGLARLSGVESVGTSPDAYNSTAHVYLKDRNALPNVKQWCKDFKTISNEAYGFRGVEVTVEATIVAKDGVLALQLPDEKEELHLVPLKHKLQWNFKKGSARQPEPDEAAAYESLRTAAGKEPKAGLRVLITGPLVEQDGQFALEVREFFQLKP